MFLKYIITSQPITEVKNTIIITRNRCEEYYMLVSVPFEKFENQTPISGRIISIDPGARTFITCYNPQVTPQARVVVGEKLPDHPASEIRNLTNGDSKLGPKVSRTMLSWRHYTFKQFLLHKANEYYDRNVVICEEAYTSKTCGACGWQNQLLRKNCRIKMDRDFNGARNILLKYLSESVLLI
ncbi:858_t:CDS:2 [Cetraspora pellucida]|uniref:858_t:CDS:1 n=1 Tax=Cetraspora pellucida TaxID=1433469 RepID=A0A9N8Z2B2_9GLOM|nr:858_t:CDS:2 [Cetraspora pellucida]